MSLNCKVCKSELYEEPLIRYYNMPNRAQFFLEKKYIIDDEGIDLFLYQCSGCGLAQFNIQEVPYYKDVIRASSVSNEMKLFRIDYFSNFINKYNLKNKKIIEIGSGCGEFLEIINSMEVDAYGLENREESFIECKKKGLKIHKGFIENKKYKIEEGPYDAFFIMNYLEHVPNPNEFLEGISRNLKDESVGIIEVPNFDMIIEKSMFSEFIRDHLFYFTKDTLKFLLNRNGFDIIEMKEIWHNYVISAIVKKRKKIDLSKLSIMKAFICKEINKYIDHKIESGKKIAVWGAGHQALTVISMSQIERKIEFIIDSATFKQNKYTPATHVKVVSPKILDEININTILVIAGSYSDEVIKIIKDKYSNIEIAVLREDSLEIVF